MQMPKPAINVVTNRMRASSWVIIFSFLPVWQHLSSIVATKRDSAYSTSVFLAPIRSPPIALSFFHSFPSIPLHAESHYLLSSRRNGSYALFFSPPYTRRYPGNRCKRTSKSQSFRAPVQCGKSSIPTFSPTPQSCCRCRYRRGQTGFSPGGLGKSPRPALVWRGFGQTMAEATKKTIPTFFHPSSRGTSSPPGGSSSKHTKMTVFADLEGEVNRGLFLDLPMGRKYAWSFADVHESPFFS